MRIRAGKAPEEETPGGESCPFFFRLGVVPPFILSPQSSGGKRPQSGRISGHFARIRPAGGLFGNEGSGVPQSTVTHFKNLWHSLSRSKSRQLGIRLGKKGICPAVLGRGSSGI